MDGDIAATSSVRKGMSLYAWLAPTRTRHGNTRQVAATDSGQSRATPQRREEARDNAQIAATLSVSEETVRNQVSLIFEKLGVENRAQAVVLARDAGLGQR